MQATQKKIKTQGEFVNFKSIFITQNKIQQ